MAVNIKIEGLSAEQRAKLMTGLAKYYGPKPDDSPLTDSQWVMLQLWHEIKSKLKSVVYQEQSVAVKAAQDAIDVEFGDDVEKA